VLTLEDPEKRESESSGPFFRTGERNLEGCFRETEISLRTEIAAVWVGETRKALETRERPGRNEKRPAVDFSTPGVKSFGRQSSYFDESSPEGTLCVTMRACFRESDLTAASQSLRC
jgi:hypothetical protein